MQDSVANKRSRIIVIGLDGFTWKILDYLNGEMTFENLERIRENGSWGKLESTVPAHTIPAWISFATGCNPGKHGVFTFGRILSNIAEYRVGISSSDIKAETIQQIIKRNGKRSVLINLHGSTPAQTDDITLGSFLSAEKDIFNPVAMAKNPEFSDYPAHMRDMVDQRTNKKKIELETKEFEVRYRIARKLFGESYDLFFVLFSEPDHVQHGVFHNIENPESDPAIMKHIIAFYKRIDESVGWFLDNMGRDDCLILLSDHGFKSYEYTFSPNSFLQANGLMNYVSRPRNMAVKDQDEKRVGLEMGPVIRLLGSSGFGRKIIDLGVEIYKRVQEMTGITNFIRFSCKSAMISPDPNRSKAASYGQYFIYINRKSRFQNGLLTDLEADELRDQIVLMLKQEKSPYTGKSPFSVAESTSQAYHGPALADGPDIVLNSEDHLPTSGSYGSVYARASRNFHDPYGIFAIYGPGIKKGKLPDKNIMDIAPTILHLLGLAVPSYMDGRVITDAFEDETMKKVRIEEARTKTTELKSKVELLKKRLRPQREA